MKYTNSLKFQLNYCTITFFILTGCYHVSSHLHLNATALRLNPDYILYYVNVAQNVVTGLIPLISLVVLNYLVYTHLVKRRKGIHWLGNENIR